MKKAILKKGLSYMKKRNKKRKFKKTLLIRLRLIIYLVLIVGGLIALFKSI